MMIRDYSDYYGHYNGDYVHVIGSTARSQHHQI